MADTTIVLPKKHKFFYGYYILAVTFICLTIMSGCNVYSFGLFLKPLQETFGWNRADIMWASTISTMMSALSSILIGRILNRYGSKRIIVAGALITTLSLVLISLMRQLWHFYLFYGISGIGFASIGFIPVSAVILNWFKKRRGTAVGLAGVGFGAGGFIMPLFVGGYLIPHFGWRVAYRVLGLLVSTIIIPLVTIVVKARPEELGLQPDGGEIPPEEVATKAPPRKPEEDLSLKEALKTRNFWLIALTGMAFGFSSQPLIQHQVAHLQDIGFPMAIAASALSAVGITNAISKVWFGFICDRIHPKYSRVMGLAFLLIALIILMNLSSASGVVAVWVYAIFVGLSMGSWLPSMSMLVSTSFGLTAYGVIFSMTGFFNMLGGASGPLFAGYIFDTQKSYHLAFIIFAVLSALATVVAFFIRPPKSDEAH